MVRTVVEILDRSLNKIGEVRSLYPINNQGYVLRYSKELSDYGQCMFRVHTADPILTQFGDILKPHQYHIRIKRDNVTVWQGAIVDNSHRTKNYIEVIGVEYLYYLDKILIRRDKDNPTTSDDESNFKTFKTGTLAAAVQTIFQNAITDLGTPHILAGATVGTINNPNYPDGFTKADGKSKLTGAWNFSAADLTVQFDYHSALYVIKQFGLYSNCDFQLTTNLVFNFKTVLGNRITGTTFHYDTVGTNIVDYDVPRLGKRMVNEIVGIATDDLGNVLHSTIRDSVSVGSVGLLQESRGYTDVKSKNLLGSRIREEERLLADPEQSPINIVLDEKGYPLGQYDIGDIIWVRIRDHVIDFQKERRIVGITVNLHNTGRELTTVQTNIPNPALLGAS